VLSVSVEAKKISLDGKWELTFWEQPAGGAITDPADMGKVKTTTIAATVPGNVELDLFAAGLMPDPYKGDNIRLARKFEGRQWCYSRSFPTPQFTDGQRLQLTFRGIDCLADVWLNGKLIGTPENMFIEHSFDITDAVRPSGDNQLKVIIRSAVLESQKYLTQSITGRNDEENFIRKAPSQYGWDIMTRIVSAGLWRGVELEVLDPVGISDVNWVTLATDPNERTARLYVCSQVRMPFDMYGKVTGEVTLTRNGKNVYSSSKILNRHIDRRTIDLKEADLWWPRGYGEAALYRASVRLKDEKGNVLAENTQNIGIRTVKLERTDLNAPPEYPGKFGFIINGERIFARGSNWVPLDGLHSRDASHYDEAMALVVATNSNILRCWGGNVYEDHRFFDLCDSCGIMVWQDFALACAIPPNSPEFLSRMYDEARSVVVKLRNHPSLILWSGSNETDDALFGQKQLYQLAVDPNRDQVTRKVFPEVLYQYDPSRPYLPSSPYISPEVFARWDRTKSPDSMKDIMPEVHLWGKRGYYKEPFYNACPAQFVSEIGYHGCPNRTSLERMFDPQYVYPWPEGGFAWNPQWQAKAIDNDPLPVNFAGGRNNLMINQVKALFGECPTDLDKFIFASQSVQAEAMKYFIEVWRASKFDKTGIIWWNIRDGWPHVSDAVCDYYNSPKRAFYYISNVQRDVCVMVLDAVDGKYPVMAVNDTRKAVKGAGVEISDVVTGKQLYKGNFDIAPNGKTLVASLPEMTGQGMLLIKYSVDGTRYMNHYLYGNPPFDLEKYRQWINSSGIYSNVK